MRNGQESLANLLKRLNNDPRIALEDDYGWWTPGEFLERYAPNSSNRPQGSLNNGAHIIRGDIVMDKDTRDGGLYIPVAKLHLCKVDDADQYTEMTGDRIDEEIFNIV